MSNSSAVTPGFKDKTECTSHVCQDQFIHTFNDNVVIHCNVYYINDNFITKMVRGSKTKLHQPSSSTAFAKLRLQGLTVGWGSRGQKGRMSTSTYTSQV